MIKKRELEQEQQEHQANMIHSSKLFVWDFITTTSRGILNISRIFFTQITAKSSIFRLGCKCQQ
jgi:hypothetical protein